MLARLRPTLDFLPSPIPDRPGLMIRDPFQYSDATLVIPPVLVESLTYFDGTRSSLDLREHLVRLTGELDVSGLEQHLIETLSGAGFLEDDNFFRKKAEVERAFADSTLAEILAEPTKSVPLCEFPLPPKETKGRKAASRVGRSS